MISLALDLFHENKHAILNAKARVGKGNKPLEHFFIPKLKLFHSVVTSIRWSGAPIQWSADATEHTHIDVIKTPSKNTNNGQYGPQICRHLDHKERRRLFNLATAIHEAGDNLESILYGSGGNQGDGGDEELDEGLNVDWIAELNTVTTACGPSRKAVNLFTVTNTLATRSTSEEAANVPVPLRTFSTLQAAFNFNWKPDIPQILVDSLAEKFNLPDLRPALNDFFSQCSQNPSIHHIGGHRRTQANIQLPFDDVIVVRNLLQNSLFSPNFFLSLMTYEMYSYSGCLYCANFHTPLPLLS